MLEFIFDLDYLGSCYDDDKDRWSQDKVVFAIEKALKIRNLIIMNFQKDFLFFFVSQNPCKLIN